MPSVENTRENKHDKKQPNPTVDRVTDLTRRADDIVKELDVVVKQMAELLRRRVE